MSVREVACLKRRIGATVHDKGPGVSYTTTTGSFTAPSLPPIGHPPATLKAFGFGLTWEEVRQIAEHPYVESIWTAPGIQFDPPPGPGCPPDLTKPIPTVECTNAREPIDEKINDVDRMQLMDAGGPIEVVISVRGGATICMLPPCSTPPSCPEHRMLLDRWKAENLASQRCVRDLIGQVGGTATPEVSWLTNVIIAKLTWAQIQEVAAYPHVRLIEPSIKDIPPPQ